MTLEQVELPEGLGIADAKQELADYWEKFAEPGSQWGYYPIMEHTEEEYPACFRLESELIEEFDPNVEDGLRLAFIQYLPEGQNPNNGALHLDVHELNDISADSSVADGKDILRVLLNLHDHPRVLRFLPVTREELEERGVEYSHDHYEAVGIPEDMEVQTVEIPPRKGNTAWILKFLGNRIPHAGLSDEKGQFLVSFGKYIQKK